MKVLEFIFQDFWHWFGALILLATATQFHPIYIDKSSNKSRDDE